MLDALIYVDLLLLMRLGGGAIVVLFLQLLDLSKRHGNILLLGLKINSFVLEVPWLNGTNEVVFLFVIHDHLPGTVDIIYFKL